MFCDSCLALSECDRDVRDVFLFEKNQLIILIIICASEGVFTVTLHGCANIVIKYFVYLPGRALSVPQIFIGN